MESDDEFNDESDYLMETTPMVLFQHNQHLFADLNSSVESGFYKIKQSFKLYRRFKIKAFA